MSARTVLRSYDPLQIVIEALRHFAKIKARSEIAGGDHGAY